MKPIVMVTGATGYFGRYFVEHLKAKYQIIAIGRDQAKLDSLFSSEVIKKVIDLHDVIQVKSVMHELLQQYDIFGLVNNAYPLNSQSGFNTPQGQLAKHDISMFDNAFGCGLFSPFVLIQELGNYLIDKRKAGAIVNISSMYASVAPDPSLYEGKSISNPISYGMVKAGMEYMTKYVASFWGPYGIRCNAIAPGSFPNVEFSSENATTDNEFMQRLVAKTCNNRVGRPQDLLGILSLLLAEDSQYINGQVIPVDGGWTVR
ncbi:SDR family oxidoreductase [Paraglaciecola sp.]|uniref:SDR family oxidoreductase n=1 Tax=Paraglaciecola sp. TaxID=1920173 RepID=UPI003266E4E4